VVYQYLSNHTINHVFFNKENFSIINSEIIQTGLYGVHRYIIHDISKGSAHNLIEEAEGFSKILLATDNEVFLSDRLNDIFYKVNRTTNSKTIISQNYFSELVLNKDKTYFLVVKPIENENTEVNIFTYSGTSKTPIKLFYQKEIASIFSKGDNEFVILFHDGSMDNIHPELNTIYNAQIKKACHVLINKESSKKLDNIVKFSKFCLKSFLFFHYLESNNGILQRSNRTDY